MTKTTTYHSKVVIN